MTLLDDVAPSREARRHQSAGNAASLRVPRRVVVRAWGMQTVFGDTRATWDALLSGRHLTDHSRCDSVIAPCRAAQLARSAASDVCSEIAGQDAALVVGTSKGSIEDWLAAAPPATGLADVAACVAASLRLAGPHYTVSAACASGLHALARGAMMIASGEATQVVVVAAEASVHPLFLGSFQRLGVLARAGEGCRPFDRNRSGFYMSEAAAAVLLEADGGGNDGSAAGVYVDGFALGGDGTHLTGGDGNLPVLRHLLRRVIDGRPVDLVHGHGTGTPTNDEAELAAIESALREQEAPPTLYSHKGALGHSLGAAGLLSVVINCQAHAHSTVPPNVQTRDPLATTRVTLSQGVGRRDIRRSVAVAAGFGGATAVVALCTRAPPVGMIPPSRSE